MLQAAKEFKAPAILPQALKKITANNNPVSPMGKLSFTKRRKIKLVSFASSPGKAFFSSFL